jgi:hypothetical protein
MPIQMNDEFLIIYPEKEIFSISQKNLLSFDLHKKTAHYFTPLKDSFKIISIMCAIIDVWVKFL